MKGVVFNLLEEAVSRSFGPETWDDLLDAAGLDGAYTSLGSYPDAQMDRLVGAAAAKLSLDAPEVLRWFGTAAMPILAERYPIFFEPHASSRPFLMSVNRIIHPEVRKLYTGAGCPHFDFHEAPDGALCMDYQSDRKLCFLAHGFIEGAAAQFNDDVDVCQTRCKQRGDAACSFRIVWN